MVKQYANHESIHVKSYTDKDHLAIVRVERSFEILRRQKEYKLEPSKEFLKDQEDEIRDCIKRNIVPAIAGWNAIVEAIKC